MFRATLCLETTIGIRIVSPLDEKTAHQTNMLVVMSVYAISSNNHPPFLFSNLSFFCTARLARFKTHVATLRYPCSSAELFSLPTCMIMYSGQTDRKGRDWLARLACIWQLSSSLGGEAVLVGSRRRSTTICTIIDLEQE